jgi:hypothetical protein
MDIRWLVVAGVLGTTGCAVTSEENAHDEAGDVDTSASELRGQRQPECPKPYVRNARSRSNRCELCPAGSRYVKRYGLSATCESNGPGPSPSPPIDPCGPTVGCGSPPPSGGG